MFAIDEDRPLNEENLDLRAAFGDNGCDSKALSIGK